jgi:hypothetical protein
MWLIALTLMWLTSRTMMPLNQRIRGKENQLEEQRLQHQGIFREEVYTNNFLII